MPVSSPGRMVASTGSERARLALRVLLSMCLWAEGLARSCTDTPDQLVGTRRYYFKVGQ